MAFRIKRNTFWHIALAAEAFCCWFALWGIPLWNEGYFGGTESMLERYIQGKQGGYSMSQLIDIWQWRLSIFRPLTLLLQLIVIPAFVAVVERRSHEGLRVLRMTAGWIFLILVGALLTALPPISNPSPHIACLIAFVVVYLRTFRVTLNIRPRVP